MRPLLPRSVVAVVALAAISSCNFAPALVSGCSVRASPRDGLIATVTLWNRSSLPIVETSALVDTKRPRPMSGNRIFDSRVRVAPGARRVMEARVVDRGEYDFKDWFAERTGCEVERVVFADGTSYEMPSPL